MARSKRSGTQKKFLYFFINDKLHKVIRSNRAKDELVAWCYIEKKRVLYSYSQVKKGMGNAYSTKQVALLLNKHKVTIEDYILEGKIKMPERVYPIGNPDSKWSMFMFSEKNILDIHEFILESGHSLNLPSRSELLAILKNNIILYTKTEEGKFVPVWKAE
jgi:hypothetical protein